VRPNDEHSLQIETVEGTAFHHCGRTRTRGVYSRVDKDATHCQAATGWQAVGRLKTSSRRWRGDMTDTVDQQ
jgi:hypothetical protein